MTRRLALGLLCASLLVLIGPASASAAPGHPLLFEISEFEPEPNRKEDLEGPCGLALDPAGDLYVSNYYHEEIDRFSPTGSYIDRMLKVEPLDGPCSLAFDAAGNLYVNVLHRGVLRYAPSEFPSGPGALIDTAHSTGLAVDPAGGDLYVDDRTYIARYEAPVHAGEVPTKIGVGGSLRQGYGLAVSDFPATAGYLYVPDAATNTVKVYDPVADQVEPVGVIDGGGTPQGAFASLLDAAVAVDDSDGHLYVTDNLQSSGYEHPRAAVDEFNSAGAYRGQLPQVPTIYAGEPNGLFVDNSAGPSQGNVLLTSGNTELVT